MSLADALERAASALSGDADAIRPANGDPARLLAALGNDRAARVLGWLLSHSPDDGEQLAREWFDDETGRSAALAVDESLLSKSGRKALRRVLHALRGRGVAIPDAPVQARVATLQSVEEEVSGAWLSPVDPAGARFALLIDRTPAGTRLFELIVDEARGITECSVYAPSRGQARQFVRRAETARGLAVRPVDPAALGALVARCEQAQPKGRAFPRGFLEHRSKLIGASGQGDTPGVLAARALGDEPTPDALARATELVRAGTLGPWPPADLAPLIESAEKLRAVLDSQLVVSDLQRREQIEGVCREAARVIYGGLAATRTAALFAESGWALWQDGKEPEARACLATARALREAPDGEHAATLALAERVLTPLIERMRARPAAESPAQPRGI